MNYVISMMDGTKMTVPQKVGEAVLEAKSPFIKFGDRMINLKSVSRIEPESAPRPSMKLPEPKGYTKLNRIRALKQMLKGINHHLATSEHTNKSLDVKKTIELRLKQAEESPSDLITRNPIQGIYDNSK